MWGYVAVFALGVYAAPKVKKKIRRIRSYYGV